jgi:nitrogen fixation protein
MITTYNEGSQSVSTTEYSVANSSTTLTPKTDAGAYQLVLDMFAMTATEQYQIRIYEKSKAGGTQRVLYEDIVSGVQTSLWVGPALALINGWDMTLKKLQGTDRSLDYSIRKAS